MAEDQDPLQNILSQACCALEIAISEKQKQQIMAYVDALDKWNQAYNLSAVRERQAMMKRHVVDALSVYSYVRQLVPASLADIGTGGGVPGVILAIMLPELPIDLVESVGKKCRFLRHVVHELGLSEGVVIQQKRVEQWQPEQPKSVLICRAFTSLANFITITQHLGNRETYWLAMKSAQTDEEEKAMPHGFILVENRRLTVPFETAKRHLITIKRR